MNAILFVGKRLEDIFEMCNLQQAEAFLGELESKLMACLLCLWLSKILHSVYV